NRIFTPTGAAPDVMGAKERAEAILKVVLTDEIPPSKMVTPKEQPRDGAVRIEDGVRLFKNRYLGAEQAETGQRVGGRYREALGEYAHVHLGRFRRMLEFRMREILNGTSFTDPVAARSGKLGYLRDFLDGMVVDLDTASQVLGMVVEKRRGQSFGRRDMIGQAQNALTDMKESRDDTRPFVGKAHRTQIAYLEAEEILMDLHRGEIMEQAIAQAFRQMLELTHSALESVDQWINTLALSRDGLYASLQRGRQQMSANRDADADVEVRLILGARKAGQEEDNKEYREFQAYEEERYQHYVRGGQTDWLASTLGRLSWDIEEQTVGGKSQLALWLTYEQEEGAESRRLSPKVDAENLDIFRTASRHPVEPARETESVLNYLKRTYGRNPDALADLMFDRSGPLLAREGGAPIPSNFMRVHHGQASEDTDFLKSVLRRLASSSQIADADRFAKLVNSTDRFKCTLKYTQEVIELDNVTAYKNYRPDYMGYQGEQQLQGSRRAVLHIFPAEVNAAQIEERLPELNQAVRLLDDDVVLQLEKPDNFRLFLLCFAYGLVNTFSYTEGGEMREVYRVQWDPESSQDRGEVWLTDPAVGRKPRLLNALMTFNYEGKDVGHGEGFFKPIEWDQLRWTLEMRRSADALRRYQEGTIGESGESIKGWLKSHPTGLVDGGEGELDDAWKWAAQRDHLSEFVTKWEEMLRNLRVDGLSFEQRQEYDLTSVFVLLLRDEVQRLTRAVSGSVPDRDKAEERKDPTSRPKTEFDPFG
ncbi:MAG: hypothetical protein H8E35_04210, partial [Ardenticatenia bacterium]|nr:hypothetical protein [Ardenticatenia bacterium]